VLGFTPYLPVILLAAQLTGAQQFPAPDQHPDLLSWDELVSLSANAPTGAVGKKLERLLATPFISNAAARSGVLPKRPCSPGSGPVLRIAEWNIDSGAKYDEVRTVLSGALPRSAAPGAVPERAAEAGFQARELGLADVVILSESDIGMPRSGYRDVAGELARDLHMNVAFGVEFVEVDPLTMGLEEPEGTPEQLAAWRTAHSVDRTRYRGLTGNAILSRYPILSARILRVPRCYDWYEQERQNTALLEHGRRWASARVFDERIARQMRRGGRMALVAELAVPESPTGILTVVSAHLEDRARPACRCGQMEYLIASLWNVRGPLVLAGDFNTSGTDLTPTSVRRQVVGRGTSAKFWLGMGLFTYAPLGIARLSFWPINYMKNLHDPTYLHFPALMPNRERGFFSLTEDFRFSDGGRFDFSGPATETRNGNGGRLASSNQRVWKGFAPTFAMPRNFNHLIGISKLDWFFVKPDPRASGRHQRCCFSPHRPLTMNVLNEAAPGRISDHAPMTVDLYLLPTEDGAGRRMPAAAP